MFSCPSVVYFLTEDELDGIVFTCTEHSVIASRVATPSVTYVDPANCKSATWFSIDPQNQQLFAGTGEARVETATYRYTLSHEDKAFMESLCQVLPEPCKIIRDPISSQRVPLTIKKSLTMRDVARGAFMHRSHLSPVARQLYDCVEDFTLEKGLAKMIDRSISTPGLWCYEKLKEKDPDLAYLRITLGQNGGESPGVPYVMEIWPTGHHSPVHNHAGSNAVIKVLRGTIHVSLFSRLEEPWPFLDVFVSKGELTWLSPTLNSVHQLQNNGSKTCITIQSYMYDDGDTSHYDYFDYVDAKGTVRHFEPDSDCEYIQFVDILKREKGVSASHRWLPFQVASPLG